MKQKNIIKIIICACIAVFAVGVLVYGLSTGFGIGDILPALGDESSYAVPKVYEEETENLDTVDIDWVSGPVKLAFYSGSTVRVTETSQRTLKQSECLQMSVSDGTLKIQFDDDNGFFGLSFGFKNSKMLTVEIPQQFADTMEQVKISTVSGDIDVADFTMQEGSFQSTSGDISLQKLQADNMKVSSISGELYCANLTAKNKLALQTTSGDQRLAAVQCSSLDFGSVSGRIEADFTADALSGSSVSGDLTFTAQKWPQTANLESVSGTVRLTAAAPEAGFTCAFSSLSGSFDSDFAVQKKNDDYINGAGGAKLKISTTSGDVKLIQKTE